MPESTNKHDHDQNDQRTFTLLEKINNRQMDPKSLLPQQRRMVISALMDQGLSTVQIAQTLKVSDRTIERDKKCLFEANALKSDPELTKKIAGDLVRTAELTIQRLTLVARDNDTPAAVKVDAIHRSFQTKCQLMEKLQSVGFINTVSQKIEANITHSLDLDEIQTEVKRLKEIEQRYVDSQIVTNFENEISESEYQNEN